MAYWFFQLSREEQASLEGKVQAYSKIILWEGIIWNSYIWIAEERLSIFTHNSW